MKCFGCTEHIDQAGETYSFNYQSQGIKFYGISWCKDCGPRVMDAIKKNKLDDRHQRTWPKLKKNG